MGVERNVGYGRYPKQGDFLGRGCTVVFDYDTTTPLRGTVIRDDEEHPYRCIIRLNDGRVVLATECQYSPDPKGRKLSEHGAP